MKSIEGVMFNAYPDSLGGRLGDIVALLDREEMRGAFSLFYILPTMFQSDLDRGFSVISYDINPELAKAEDLASLRGMNIGLFLDFVLNHLSVGSPQFQDLLARGDESEYRDFFIDWNEFWEGRGEKNEEGLLIPRDEDLNKLFMRKPGLPVLKLPFPDGSSRWYWNTFYQSVEEGAKGPRYLGQMDLNGESPRVWDFYAETLDKFKAYGADIVRLDAFAYLHKEPGMSNFFNEPGTWQYLDRLRQMARDRDLLLLPEIHAAHSDGIHRELAKREYPIYDFFFPALAIHSIETGDAGPLLRWIGEILDEGYQCINMLGCHDGIPVLDVKGLLEDTQIDELIDTITSRGGRLKDLYGPDGKKIAYYQVNATFYSAFGEDDRKFLLARALQLFMPGVPLVWYLDLFAGSNDYAAADSGGHKEINRTNLEASVIEERIGLPVVVRQLEMIKFRNHFPAFGTGARIEARPTGNGLEITQSSADGASEARLEADLTNSSYRITYRSGDNKWSSLQAFPD
jgi:sucrose phosphorylase